MTHQELEQLITPIAIKHHAFVIDDCLCGDGMDIIGFAKEIIQLHEHGAFADAQRIITNLDTFNNIATNLRTHNE